MRVKFKKNYIGRETSNKYMKADDELDVEHQAGLDLIRWDVAEEVKIEDEPAAAAEELPVQPALKKRGA